MLTQFAFKYWRYVGILFFAGVILGIIGIFTMPVQLLPNVDRTQITIESQWLQNTPQDVEEQMAIHLEKELKTLPGLKEIESEIVTGSLSTTLTFDDKIDPLVSLIATSSRLNQVRSWPEDATRPVVINDGITSAETVATLLLYPKHESRVDWQLLEDTVKEVVSPALLTVEGVNKVSTSFSHRDRIIWLNLKPGALSQYGLTLEQLKETIEQIRDVGAGTISLGKDRISVRFKGKTKRQDLREFVVAWEGNLPVYLGALVDITEGFTPPTNLTYKNGHEAYYFNLLRGHGENSFEILERLRSKIALLNQHDLAPLGLELGISLDTSLNIRRAINVVGGNLLLGAALVYLVLYIFIRRHSASLVVMSSVPVSLLISIGVLKLLGGNLNVISLAGLAFSVGLIIDAAVVVQEAIVASHRNSGVNHCEDLSRGQIVDAAKKVTRALVASTLTTLVIFLPISQIDSEVGQLLSDLALTMSVSIVVSTLSALCFIPPLFYWLQQRHIDGLDESNQVTSVFHGGHGQTDYWRRLALYTVVFTNSRFRRWVVIVLLIIVPLALFPFTLPHKDLLPNAGDTMLRATISIPGGRDIEVLNRDVAQPVIERLKVLQRPDAPVRLASYNLVIATNFAFIVAYPEKPEQLNEMMDIFREEVFGGIPEIEAFVMQEPMIFFRSSSSRNIHLNIHGDDLSAMLSLARTLKDDIAEQQLAASIRVAPSEQLNAQQFIIQPDNREISYYGMDYHDVSDIISTHSGGIFSGEYVDGKDRYDFYIKGTEWQNRDELLQLPVTTPGGEIIHLGKLTDIELTNGPSTVLRYDGMRTVRLVISPLADKAIAESIADLKQLVQESYGHRLAEHDLSLSMKGSADEFEQAMHQIIGVIFNAMLVLMLLVALTFRSFRESFYILLTMPVALIGGAIALHLLTLFTTVTLDILTMIGFIIAMGLIVNNAILVLTEYQSLREAGHSQHVAITRAIQSRARPIYVAALTSIFGMVPLMLSPGTGAEMYRGMATVLVGSMTFSMLFSVFIVAALLSGQERRPKKKMTSPDNHKTQNQDGQAA